MDKLRILPVAFVFGLLSIPAFAQLTTIGPGTPGVTESIMTLQQQTFGAEGAQLFSPIFAKVALGTLPGGFDDQYLVASSPNACLDGCLAVPGTTAGISVFDVTFSKPVSTVSVLQMGIANGNAAYLLALNSSHQLVGICTPVFEPPQPPGCSPIISATPGDSFGFLDLTVGSSTPDISTVLIAGADGSPAFGTAVQFSAIPVSTPEPATLGLMFLGLGGVGFAARNRRA